MFLIFSKNKFWPNVIVWFYSYPSRQGRSSVIGVTPFYIWRIYHYDLVSVIQTYRPWTPRRTSGLIVNQKIWHESDAYRNFGKRFDWSLAIKRHIVMAAPIVETILLVNGFKRLIVMTAPFAITAPSCVQNLMNSSSRRFDGKSMSLDDRDYIETWND